jgi:conjugative relaxase-like TrwC/TraI family protein
LAYVTAIGADPAQVDYRLGLGHGCTEQGVAQVQFSYHADGRERPLRWVGSGLEAFGIAPGSELTPDQFDAARALMAGCDPRSGQRLVAPKLAVLDGAKLPLPPLLQALRAAAGQRDVGLGEMFAAPKDRAAIMRAERAVARSGDGARLRADEAGHLAEAAGLDPGQVWGTDAYRSALGNLTHSRVQLAPDGSRTEVLVPRRAVVGNLGYDISFTLPKSHSLLLAFADEATAHRIEAVYDAAVADTFAWLESSTCYGMRGKHGEGRTAQTVQGNGFAGWAMTHRAARPIGDAVVGDPHWHVHVTIANLTRGGDGKWSTVGAGGRDLMRHAPAVDHVLKALVRRELSDSFGVSFQRSERTGAWEVTAIPDATLVAFSKRGASIAGLLTDLGFDPDTASRRAQDLAAAQSRQHKSHATAAPDATLRQIWQDQARAQGVDPVALAATALPGRLPQRLPEEQTTLAVVVDRLLDPESGLTATGRRFTRADALAAVADALPHGAGTITEIEGLTDKALAHPQFLALPAAGAEIAEHAGIVSNGPRHLLDASHMTNAARWSTADVFAAEQVILRAAAGRARGAACVGMDAAGMAISAVEATAGHRLSHEQASAVLRLTASDRALDAVLGAPGTGKTTMLAAARTAWDSEGFVVAGAATAAVAAANLQVESGIASRTLAQWLHRIDTGPGLAGVDVLVLDEANLTDDRARAALYTEAARTGTKVVEVGDPQQLRGVGCGSLFGRVHAMVDGPVLTENHRQRDADERAAITAWREGRPLESLESWAARGRIVAADTPDAAVAGLLAKWMHERVGAPDAHTEIASVVMLAATNLSVERLNTAAQAVRAATGELGHGRTYNLEGGRDLLLHEGDHVLIRLNDRNQRMHEGPDVLNGYRGVVEHIGAAGRLAVAWRKAGPDGPQVQRAVLDPGFIASGGLSLGYAMTVHKAEGLTVGSGWARPDGTSGGGVVLVHAAGMDPAALHVATTRHRERVLLFAAPGQLEQPPGAAWDRSVDPVERVVSALAQQAGADRGSPNDVPLHDDLGRTASPTSGAAPVPEPAADSAAERRELMARLELNQLADQMREAWTAHADTAGELARAETQLSIARDWAARCEHDAHKLADSTARLAEARQAAEAARAVGEPAAARIAGRTTGLREQIHAAWAREYEPARAAAADYLAGPGRLGMNQRRVNRAEDTLHRWAAQWRHLHPGLDTTDTTRLAWQASLHPANHDHILSRSFAARVAEQAHLELPGEHAAAAAAKAATKHAETVAAENRQLDSHQAMRRLSPPGLERLHRDPARAVEQATDTHLRATEAHTSATARITQLREHPIVQAQPDPEHWIENLHTGWSAARTVAAALQRAARAAERAVEPDHSYYRSHHHDLHREGPNLGL